MSETHEAVGAFWKWFESNSTILSTEKDPDADAWNEAFDELHRVHPRLFYEFCIPTDSANSCEFVVTAAGNADLFPIVDSLVAHAPVIAGWEFVALKPCLGFEFQTEYEGIHFDPKKIWFMPMTHDQKPKYLGVLLGIPNYKMEIHKKALAASAIILDTGLGERSAAMDIQFLDVGALPTDPGTEGFMELSELPDYIQFRKKNIRRERYND